MVERLWVPLIHSLVARNWNWAICGAPFTAFRVANSVGVSTPLRGGFCMVTVMAVSFRLIEDDSGDARDAAFPGPSSSLRGKVTDEATTQDCGPCGWF